MSDVNQDKISFSKVREPFPANRVNFGQEILAEFVESQIRDHPGIDLAINGPWGTGKTTILEAIQDKFDEGEYITVWYEPWRYSPDQTTLRRTFLEQLYDDVNEELDLEYDLRKSRLHQAQSREQERSYQQLLGDFLSALYTQRKPALLLIGGVIFLWILSELFALLPLGGVELALASLARLTIPIFIVAGVLFFQENTIGLLSELTTYEIKEPKISEIDQFEKQYMNILNEISNEEQDLIIFVDDIDRCNSNEMREVIIGLSTYLDPTKHDTEISFVAAIDGPKVANAFDEKSNEKQSNEKPNILHKTFDFVLPVPTPTYENVCELINATSDDLGYNISRPDQDQIASIAVSHGHSNLRIIRSALSDVIWMGDYTKRMITNGNWEKSDSLERIISSDYLLFRIALIKMLSENEDLRRFLADADIWLQRTERKGDIMWELFEEKHPKFSPEKIDPRQLLALNTPNDLTANVTNFSSIKDSAESGDSESTLSKCENYDSGTQVDIIYRLLDFDLQDYDTEERADYVSVIIDLAVNSLSSIDQDRAYVFDTCFQEVKNDKNMVDNVSRDSYSDWYNLAKQSSPAGLKELLSDDCPFYQKDERYFLRELGQLMRDEEIQYVDRYLQLEIDQIDKGNLNRSVKRVSQVFTNDSIGDSENGPKYLITAFDNWDFTSDPEGLPEDLLKSSVIDQLHLEPYMEDAIRIFEVVTASGSEARDFLNVMMDQDWPRATSHLEDEESQ